MVSVFGQEARGAACMDYGALSRDLLPFALSICQRYLPDGERKGNEWVAINPRRSDSSAGSFKINLRTGKWADFATNEKGGDLIALVAYLHDMKQSEAAEELKQNFLGGNATTAQRHPATKAQWVPITPIPDAAPVCDLTHPEHGECSQSWTYRDAQGKPLAIVCRFDKGGGEKVILPLTYCMKTGTSRREWRWQGLPEPRPLYNLNKLVAEPEAPVVVVEGEKSAEAFTQIAPRALVTTAMHGAQSPHKTDWSDVAGRTVFIWPDNDQAGREYADKVARLAYDAGAAKVSLFNLAKFAHDAFGLSQGWDAADAVAEGWTGEQIRELLADPEFLIEIEPSAESEDVPDVNEEAKEAPPNEAQPTLGSIADVIDVASINTNPEEEFSVRQWPVLSERALVGLAGEFVSFVCERSEADPAAVLFQYLTAAGCFFGRDAYVAVDATKHHPRFFSAVVGSTAKARKGTSSDPVEELMKLVGQCGVVAPKITGGPLSSGEGLIHAVRDASERLDKEGKTTDPGVADKRLLVIDGELSSALKVMQRDGNTLSAILRGAWDGKTLAPLTKNNQIVASDPHICIVGHITSEELKELLAKCDVFNGFVNRFLWVCARRQKLVPVPQALDRGRLLECASTLATTRKSIPNGEVEWSADARKIWKEIYPQLSSDDQSGALGAITGRGEAQTIRLALVYMLLDTAQTIQPKHLEAALAAWQYCFDSARYIYGGVESNPLVRAILESLKNGARTQTELSKLFQGHASSDKLRGALMKLQASGRITCDKQAQNGGRPTTVWSLTPGFESSGR